jgi:acyltransferase-like protein
MTADSKAKPVRPSLWARASQMAEQTPADRNRYVDFLRALSICAVVIGHWLVAAPHLVDGRLVGDHLLGIVPWTQWLTWGFQVMPLFFLVGGYSNGISWSATCNKGGTYAQWLVGRIQRLINPVIPLFLLWIAFAGYGRAFGVSAEIVKLASQLALVPVWFLAVYLVVVALVPLTWRAWQEYGMKSFLLLFGCAVVVDVAVFATPAVDLEWLSFLNFAFVWLGVHQLGYAWYAQRLQGLAVTLPLCVGSLVTLITLVRYGPYPIAMIGVPGQPVSNSMPPTMALFMLGLAQTGLVLSLESVGRRWLAGLKVWTGVILLNGMIMTVYLWHLTAFILVTAAAYGIGVGLAVDPGGDTWWIWRPLWIALYLVALVPFIGVFARFEQGGLPIPSQLSRWRLITAVVFVCAGLALTAAGGVGSDSWTGIRLWVVALPFIGAGLVDFGPLARSLRSAR